MVKRALASLSYHRRFLFSYTLLLTIILPPLLFINTLRRTLIQTGKNLAITLEDGEFPQVSQTWLDALIKDLHTVFPLYNLTLMACCFILGGGMLYVGYRSCLKRQGEHKTYCRLGISRKAQLGQLILEFMLPAFFSLLLLAVLLLAFQGPIESLVENVQSHLVDSFTQAAKMHTPQLSSESTDSFPIVIKAPANGLLLLEATPFTSTNWLQISLQAIGVTAVFVLATFLMVLPILHLLLARRSVKK